MIDAYIEGKCISEDQFKKNYFLADIISLINSKSPGTLPNIACSSLISRIDDQIKHMRVLDYPLGPYSSKFEWDLFFNLQDFNKVFSATFTDLPLPALTSLNEHGISMALHQRNSSSNNYRGSSIFDLTSGCSLFAKNSDDIIKHCNEFDPINNWGLIFSFNEENLGMELEVSPSSSPIVKKHNLDKTPFVYINNKSLAHTSDKSFGDTWDKYCELRTSWVEKNLSASLPKENFFKLPETKAKDNFTFHTITPASIQSIEMDVTSSEFNKVLADSVKAYVGQTLSSKINWQKGEINQEIKGKKTRKKNSLEEYYSVVSKAQYYWDQIDVNQSLHYANRAIKIAPTNAHRAISQFFYSFFLFCTSKNKTLLAKHLDLLIDCSHEIPDFLKPDAILLTNYYLHYLGLSSSGFSKVELPHQNQFNKLIKMPRSIFKSLFKHLYIPRYETFSVGKVYYLIEAVGSP